MASEKKQVEQSALINLDSLEVKRSRSGGGVGMEESGLIDLSGFTGGGPTESRETAGVPSGGPVVAGFVAAPKQSNTTLWVVLGGIVLAILVTVTIFVTMILTQSQVQPPIANAPPATPAPAGQTPPATPAAPTAAAAPATPATPAADAGVAAAEKAADAGSAPVAANDAKEAARPAAARPARRASARPSRPSAPAAAPSPARRAPSEEDEPPPAEAPKPVAAAPKPAPPPPKEETSEVDDLLGSLNGKKPSAAATGGGDSDPVGAPADPMLPSSLTKRQILTVVKRNAGGVRKCKAQPPGASGTVTVKMQIAPNGSVSSADIIGGPVKGTAQGNCVERTVKVFRFPQFSGDPMQINMPFAM